MRITDLLSRESVQLNVRCTDKRDAILQAVDAMDAGGRLADKKVYADTVFAREAEGTTGVGEGIAIPHGRSAAVKQPGLAALTIPDGVDYQALDDAPVNLLFLIAAPKDDASNVHLDMLSKLSAMLMDTAFTDKLRAAKTVDEFLAVIDAAEGTSETASADEAPGDLPGTADTPYILAVTGCPTGIAHTYMAAEAIEKKAVDMGYRVKVETRGSSGAKNVLTAEEIANADGIIVASDTQVPMSRFDGKRLVVAQVSDGIAKPQELIERALNERTPLYKADKADAETETAEAGSRGQRIYKYLMNGVSHMLPFVVGGGILIALAFLIDGMMVDLNALPAAERANFGSITPFAATLKDIGGVAFGFMLPILAGFIAMAIADRPGLVVGFIGGAIAASHTSGFLGALLAGFVAGYLVRLLVKATAKFPQSIDGIRTILIYPLFGVLFMGLIMLYIIEPVVGGINTGLNNWLAHMGDTASVVLGLIVAGMMAIDMGGPFNKAAYVFGTAQIAAGNYNIMAAVMIGGMVPPCAIALSTLLFKKKFTASERRSGPVNFIMGLSFITEGAIPYAAADPLRVIPSCIIGSAAAGGLSMLFNCTLMAPHGGIFVFPVVGNALLYLVSLVVGSVIAAVLMGLLKKNKIA
ncbi:MAG: fructose-specific PTS transporter subunit EIIC [Eubacteriales bacterium]|nr:fructose-specific PTS transporter subunit EIIC [Eubacteriales bacterium]